VIFVPKKPLKFKSKAAYQRWLAYGHMRTAEGRIAKKPSKTIFAEVPGHQKIMIAGKPHRVRHTSGPNAGDIAEVGTRNVVDMVEKKMRKFR